MNDPIRELLQQIGASKTVTSTKLFANFLDQVGEVFELYGFGTTEVFLLEKQERADTSRQAQAALEVLAMMETVPLIHKRRAIGRTIFKTLPTIAGRTPRHSQRRRANR